MEEENQIEDYDLQPEYSDIESVDSVDDITKEIILTKIKDDNDQDFFTTNITNSKNSINNKKGRKGVITLDIFSHSEKKSDKFVSKRVNDKRKDQVIEKRKFNPRLPPYFLINKN